MKTLLAVVFLALIATTAAPAQEEGGIGMFYSSLGSQGEWISMEGGTYAWRPSGVEADWRPYSDGHWVWTDDGWYWASDEPWAWATYHYGRWYNDDYYGWVWVPGYEWAPAWVEWRYGGDYIGWAPLSPYAVFSANWGVHYRRYWATPAFYWSFVDCRYMGFHDMHRYLYRPTENMRFIGRTRTAGSVRYDNGRIITRGPEREFVEQRGNIRIPRTEMVDVRERAQAGMMRNNGSERIQVYRPRIDGTSRVTTGTRPDRVRVDDHTMGLDPRGTDIRRFDDARQPRETTVAPRPDVRRSDEGRQRETVVPRADVRRYDEGRPAPVVHPSAPNTVRERPQRPPDRPADVRSAPSRQERRSPATFNTPRGGNWSPPQRGAAPSGRTERSGGERSGGDRGGGGRGGRR
jgi:hypothetical protein